MRIGVEYYPEHWDKSLWEKDADLMREVGVQVVRMGEFAWSRFEPTEGDFHFEWLDEAVALFAQRGIDVVLCTPTSCPPLWLYEKYPDAIQTGKDGRRISIGIRGHRCYNSPNFLRFAKRIIDKMTQHYAGNKAVIAWQIDNELEANFCFCEHCIAEFRAWMKEKYGTIEKINAAYGNNVWSGEYSAWEQIDPPYGTLPHAWLNPSFVLDFNRYASDNMIQFVRMQSDIIRKNCPGLPITTNTWFCENMPDFYKEFADLEFVSYDNYPTTSIPSDPEVCYSHAFHLDLMRGVKRQNFWIMEQLSGGMGTWMPMVRAPQPGMIKGYALQAFAHGADTVVHFRWRTAVTGAEMHWHGLIDHSNVPGRRFAEFRDLCAAAKELQGLAGSEIRSDVAILYSADNEYAFKIQPQTQGMYYFEQIQLLHDAFTAHGVNVDVIGQHENLTGYKVVVAPEMYVTDPAVVERLYEFARNGGTVLLTARSGVHNEYNTCIMDQLPTVYRDLVGAHAEEYDPLGTATVQVTFGEDTFTCKQWADVLAADSAEVLAAYDENYYKGAAAVTRNMYGDGAAYYVGTVGEKALYKKLAARILAENAIPHCKDLPAGIEITTRTKDGADTRFLFNNKDCPQTFALDGENVTLAPFEMKIC